VVLDGQAAQDRNGFRIELSDPQAGGVEEFDGGESGLDQRRQRSGGGGEVGEQQQFGRRVRLDRDGSERGLGDERQGAFAADDQVGQQVDGAGVVDEGVDAVAHGVLDRIQPADRRDRGWVPADPVT
jgi:hypothetical protein